MKAKNYSRSDELWRKAVKLRAGNKCEKCGATKYLQAHHVIPRTNWALRFNERNGVCLCRRHHLYWAHKDALEFGHWFKEKRPDDFIHIEYYRHATAKNDYGLIEIYLENKIKQLEE